MFPQREWSPKGVQHQFGTGRHGSIKVILVRYGRAIDRDAFNSLDLLVAKELERVRVEPVLCARTNKQTNRTRKGRQERRGEKRRETKKRGCKIQTNEQNDPTNIPVLCKMYLVV